MGVTATPGPCLTDPRIAAADATVELVDTVIPEFRAVHQLGAQLAQGRVRGEAVANQRGLRQRMNSISW